ncbi:VCBS repeat-containing protein, partial [Persicitalea sp.]|uniref:VCBS repeat-containing protein n=1 Tax=Persicitalea sp. TaxID=3100273 RepID=UPI0035936668
MPFLSCQKQKGQSSENQGALFTILTPQESGIQFRNDLRETLYMNGLFYEYYYNGGGVAVGDFNGDDFSDVYFVSNLESNRLYLNQCKAASDPIRFQDATEVAGVGGKAAFPTGVTTVDINSDGRLDIYVSASGKFEDPEKRRNELYVNMGNDASGVPIFEEQARKYQLDIAAFSTQAAFFDYDRDGDLDMFLINHDVNTYGNDKLEEYLITKSDLSSEQLYENREGIFVDVSDKSGIVNNRLSYGLGLSVGDVNNDGWPDVYVSHDYSEKDHLYLNQRNGVFREAILDATGHMSFFSMGNDMADYNNDGWMDILTVDMVAEDNYGIKTSMSGMDPARFTKHVDLGLHRQYMFNALQTNNGTVGGDGTPLFSETAQLAGISNTDWSWGPLIFDMDNDGFKDIFISNGIKRGFHNNDFRNYHEKVRNELSKQKSIDEAAYIEEVMSKMPTRKKSNYFLLNNKDLTFSKMNKKWSLDSILTSSNGAAYADFDNDGDADLVVNNMDDFAFVYRNNSNESTGNNFLKVKLAGTTGNPLGIGARVTINTSSGTQVQEHYLTRGFQSSVAPGLLFGLGREEKVKSIQVLWPNGSTQILENIDSNQEITLSYNSPNFVDICPIPLPAKLYPFFDISSKLGKLPAHQENNFDDYQRESLLPHKMSQTGPALAVGDVNGDGLDDFFLGGAMGYPGTLQLQTAEGTFQSSQSGLFSQEKKYEDVAATFFDADRDGDLDLYVVSGGNEREEGSKLYQDRLYLNSRGTFSASSGALPTMLTSGSCVKPYDFDGDGDLDLFVGGRQTPGRYPV